MAQQRTRHDFFYFQIATSYMRNYNKVEKDMLSEESLNKIKKIDWASITRNAKSMEEYKKILEKAGYRDFVSKFMQIRMFGNIIAVFSALCLESLINDYCIINKSFSYFSNYIDKLDPVSKWLIVPKIIVGREISTDGQAFELLKALYSYRNNLVHPKSKELEPIDIDSDENQIIKDFLNFASTVPKCYAAISHSTKELKEIDPDFKYLENYEWLWTGDLTKFKNITDIEGFISTFVNEFKFVKE